jgi:hypothetical protein
VGFFLHPNCRTVENRYGSEERQQRSQAEKNQLPLVHTVVGVDQFVGEGRQIEKEKERCRQKRLERNYLGQRLPVSEEIHRCKMPDIVHQVDQNGRDGIEVRDVTRQRCKAQRVRQMQTYVRHKTKNVAQVQSGIDQRGHGPKIQNNHNVGVKREEPHTYSKFKKLLQRARRNETFCKLF